MGALDRDSLDTFKATAVLTTGVSQIDSWADDTVSGEKDLEPGGDIGDTGEGGNCMVSSSVAAREMVV